MKNVFREKEKKIKVWHIVLVVVLTALILASTVIFAFWYIWEGQPKGALVVPKL